MKTKRAILPLVLLSATSASAPGAAVASPGRPPAVAPGEKQPKERVALRTALYRAGRGEASRDMARFRPLCDADGYPLVGNVAGKDRGYSVVAYCTDVRAGKESKRRERGGV